MIKNEKPKKLILLEKSLRLMAVLVLKKYSPRIVGITGSVGKTSAKEAVFTVLAGKFRVRRNEKNYNNEIGLPLTIIGAASGSGSLWGWSKVFFKWLAVIFFPVEYPEILILEMGADRPGDIKYLTDFISPSVGVITDISGSHLEFFKNLEGVAKEKGGLVRDMPENNLAILNFDNPYALGLKEEVKAQILTFGFSAGADIQAADVFFAYDEKAGGIKGLSFKLNHRGTTIPMRLPNVLARHQIYAVLSAVVAGIHFGLNLVEIGMTLQNFYPPAGRMNLLRGIKKTSIIDDTYNSSPASNAAALATLGEIKAKRKIAVLGDMLELGSETESSHRALAKKFLEIKGDIFLAVGQRMRAAAEELKKNNFSQKNIFIFDNPAEAGRKLQEVMREGDLILVKGSQGMRMEKVVEEVMAEPQKAGELLCRQNKEWKERPFKLA
jgi:UDP-N-acetylmuramoyl-tripeptide--D-alanyl-D-alanine ligase